jgi:cation diffusion facilitator family transporter
MANASARVVYTALAGNTAIAAAKLGAFALSGSSAMLTEAIHSVVDTTDQILLLVGQARGRRAPDVSHPLGYGMETYFWSFIVALLVFMLGGAASLYQGVRHILAPAPITSPWLSLAVLALAALFEGMSFVVGFREYKRFVRGRAVGGRAVRLWTFIQWSKDPSLFATLLEDSGALIGIGLAALGVIAAAFFHIAWADGAASVAIGLLLVGVSGVLANETRTHIAGEAVAPPIMEEMKRVLAADSGIEEIANVATLHLGPQIILVALTLRFRAVSSADLREAIRTLTAALKAVDDRVAYVFVRPLEKD